MIFVITWVYTVASGLLLKSVLNSSTLFLSFLSHTLVDSYGVLSSKIFAGILRNWTALLDLRSGELCLLVLVVLVTNGGIVSFL